jgi:hypothetical protein
MQRKVKASTLSEEEIARRKAKFEAKKKRRMERKASA